MRPNYLKYAKDLKDKALRICKPWLNDAEYAGLEKECVDVVCETADKLINMRNEKAKKKVCGYCKYLRPSDSKYAKADSPLWQVCDHYRRASTSEETRERRPSNMACFNFEYSKDNFYCRKKELPLKKKQNGV